MRGLGVTAADCLPTSDWSFHNFLAAVNPSCWQYSQEAWREIAQIQTPPQLQGPAAPADIRMVPADEADAQAQIAAIIAATKARQNQQMQDFFASQPGIAPAGCQRPVLRDDGSIDCADSFGFPWWAWALGGVAAVAILVPPSGRRR